MYESLQRIIGLLGTSLLIIIGVFPPWEKLTPVCRDAGCVVLPNPFGHRFILLPPSGSPGGGIYSSNRGFQLDIRRWAVESVTVVFMMLGFMFGLNRLSIRVSTSENKPHASAVSANTGADDSNEV